MSEKKNIVLVCQVGQLNNNKPLRNYNYTHINTMRNMLLAVNAEYDQLIVLTNEDPELIHPEFQVIPLDEGEKWQTWWAKIQLYNKNLPIEGVILYVDLDCVPTKHFNKLWDYPNDQVALRQTFPFDIFSDNANQQHNYNQDDDKIYKYNTSVQKFPHGSLHYVYEYYTQFPNLAALDAHMSSKPELDNLPMLSDEVFVCAMFKSKQQQVISLGKDLLPLYQFAISPRNNKWQLTDKFIPERSIIPEQAAAILFAGPFKPWTVMHIDKTIRELYT